MKKKTPISQFISMLLLLAISWTTLSGSLQFCYGDLAEDVEWGEEWARGEGEEGHPEDTFHFSGSGEEEEESPRTRSLTPKENHSGYHLWPYGCLSPDLSFETSYIAALSSFRHKERECLSISKPPLFILYCSYTSCLPVLS